VYAEVILTIRRAEEVKIMACEEWQTGLTDWALDELSPQKAQQLEQHIEQCAACGQAAARLRGVRQALMSSLTDRPMPAHLVFVEDKPKSLFAGFRAALLRTAALSATAAAIFLAVVLMGFRYGGGQLLPSVARVEPALTRMQLQAYVAQAVVQQVALQREESGTVTKEIPTDLHQQQLEELARMGRQLQYLELAQTAVWKETQRQNEVINLVAQNRLQPADSRPPEPIGGNSNVFQQK
jgi:anti-sigma factor RsiW